MAKLFQKDVRTINEHVQSVFAEAEWPKSAIRKFRITAGDGKGYDDTQHYNLESSRSATG